MSDVIDIIISAIDQASDVFNSIVESATGMGESISDATVNAGNDFDTVANNVSGFNDAISSVDSSTLDELADTLGMDTDRVQELIDAGANVGSIPFNDAAASAEEFGGSVQSADGAVQGLGNDLEVINSSMFLQLGDQLANVAGGAEDMAQEMNEASITVGQLATNTGIAEPQLVNMINTITSADFPHEDALTYVEALNQMGVSAEHLADSATAMDVMGDATGMNTQQVVSLTQSLRGLGVSADNLPSSFNAIAYAQANVNGGAETLQTVFKRQAGTLNEYGVSIDQAVVMMQALSKQGVQGMKMGSALSEVLKENEGDMSAVEQQLGLTAGTLTNASSITGQYQGKLEELASEEGAHKTILDQLGAAWQDLSLAASSAFSPILSVIGLIGQVGSFGMQVKGLQELVAMTRKMTEIEIIDSAVKSGKAAIMSVVTVATTLYASIVGVLTGEIGLVAAATAVWNAILAMNPVMLVVIALVALVAIIYEVGKAFGWWSDVQGMMSAIWDGINRIWQAFINHPDVQAVISAIGDAWNSLVGAITGAWNAVMEFLGLNTSGDFDVVATIINGIGQAWDLLRIPINAVIQVVQTVIDVFSLVASGQMDIFTAIMTIWNSIAINFGPIVQTIGSLALNFASMLLTYAIQAGTNFLNGIITYVSQLPGRVYTYLLNVATRIVAMGTRWVNTARQKANQMVIGIITYLMTLPGRVYSALMGVVSRITGAIHSWINAAKSKVRDVINAITSPFSGVAGAISGALSGVANAIKAPFEAAWNAIEPLVSKIQDGMKLIGAAGGEMAAGGETFDVNANRNFNISTGEYVIDDSPIVIEDNLNISLDLSGVPRGVNTNELVTAIQDRNVLNALVTNRDFQDLDARVKQRINLKNVRARGR